MPDCGDVAQRVDNQMIEARRIRDAVVAKTGKKAKIYTFTWMDYYTGEVLHPNPTFLDQVCRAPS
jgi:hypothetical protein